MSKGQSESGSSDAVRKVFLREYVQPARHNGSKIRVRQGELKSKMVKLGFPSGNANQIGTSIEADRFLAQEGLRLCSPKGQSRKNETIYEFEFVDPPVRITEPGESPEQRAYRLTEKIRGLMKGEIDSFGGPEAFMRWVRSDEDEAA